MKKIEILAPSGSKEALIGAINAGANAVYLAGKRFGARAYAANFEDQDMIDVICYAHLRGVFVYVAINTIIYDDEIDDLLIYTDFLVKHHVDAFIIQDLGVIHLLSKRYPKLDLHASTQMNTHHINQVKFLKEIGVKRIVMARETSIDIIKQIKKEIDIEIEVFVHGALCVCYSGNCLMSSMIGGRSGNRGECAQPCRHAYSLLKDNKIVSDTSYLLSTKDLMTLDHIDQLIDAGVDSIKIEGRMRKPEYVIQTVKSYKQAIEHSISKNKSFNMDDEVLKLKKVFNREFTEGYLFNIIPKEINHDLRPNHMGIEIGKVIDFRNNKATIKLTDTLSVNDGIRIIGKTDAGDHISRILKGAILVKKAEANEVIQIDLKDQVEVGSIVLKTTDSELENELNVYLSEHYKTISLKGTLEAFANCKLKLTLSDGYHQVTQESEIPLEPAIKSISTKEMLYDQVTKLGQTPFYFESIDITTDEKAFVSVKVLNQLRRDAIKELEDQRLNRQTPIIKNEFQFEKHNLLVEQKSIVKVTNMDQLNLMLKEKDFDIYLEDRIKVEEQLPSHVIRMLKRIQPKNNKPLTETVVVHDSGTLFQNHGQFPLITSEFFNVSNIYAAHLLYTYGAKRVTLSLELSRERIQSFVSNYSKTFNEIPNLEMVIYGRAELMISKYCPIAKTYKTKQNCLLCEKNQYTLKDRTGKTFPLIHDGQCNIKLIHHQAMNLIPYFAELKKANITNFRIEYTIENQQEIKEILENYKQSINDQIIKSSTHYHQGRYLK